MSDLVHLNTKAKAVSDCFTKLANQKTYQCQWRTNDQWARLVWSFYRDVLSPYFIKEDLDGKTLDMALRKDKLIKINLSNYTVGTNATGIMCRFFSPRLIINDKEIKIRTYCYISVPPFTAEPQPPTGKKWFDTLPPTKTRESQRCKRVRSDDPELETNEENTVDSIADNQPESDCCVKMQMDYEYDPWDDIKVRKLFAPLEDEHPMDAIARRIDIFMEARKTVEGYKNLIIGGDPYDNCTEVDKIKLQDKAMYLIAALRFALSSYPKSTWTECCEKASKTCSALTTPYCQRTVQDWWSAFKVNDGFIHPRGAEG